MKKKLKHRSQKKKGAASTAPRVQGNELDESELKKISGGSGEMQPSEMTNNFDPEYLSLQQKLQDESRRFTLLTNIMKTKHDTAKNSINNVR